VDGLVGNEFSEECLKVFVLWGFMGIHGVSWDFMLRMLEMP